MVELEKNTDQLMDLQVQQSLKLKEKSMTMKVEIKSFMIILMRVERRNQVMLFLFSN